MKELFEVIEQMFKIEKKESRGIKLTKKQIIMAEKLWKDFKYSDLMHVPPKKKPCFLAGTLVHTPTGLVPIENIKTGDQVISYDVLHQKVIKAIVTETFKNYAEKYLIIKTLSGDSISVTGQHLFYQKESNAWIKAHQLQKDMLLYNPLTQVQEKITDIQIVEKTLATYNFEVDTYHNYLVGKTGILAHNGKYSFSSTELIEVQFYVLTKNEGAEKMYVGQTTKEDESLRLSEHRYEVKPTKKDGTPKKHNVRKKAWMDEVDGISRIRINGKIGRLKMTPFEAAVVETYELNVKGGKEALYNRKNPVSKRSFEKWKKEGIFNPCKFYV